MGRRTVHDTTDVFRLKKTGLHYNKDAVAFEGPYLTSGAANARKAWNKGYDELVVQKLVAIYAYPAYLEWVDFTDENFDKDGNYIG